MVVSLRQFHRGRSGCLPSEGGVGGSQGESGGVGGSRGETCETLTPEQLRFRRLQRNRLKNLLETNETQIFRLISRDTSESRAQPCVRACVCACVCVCARCRGVTLTGAWTLPVRRAVHDGKSSCWWEFQTWQLLVQNSQLGPDGLPPAGRDARYSKHTNMQGLISTSRQKLHSHRL